jgi:hypothetical protein
MLNWWEYFRGKPSSRKYRLLACASCRLILHLITDECLLQAIETAEAHADGLADKANLVRLHAQAHALGMSRGEVLSHMSNIMPGWSELSDSWRVAHAVADAAGPDDGIFGNAMHSAACDGGKGKDTEDAGQAALIREILGNPFQPAFAEPEWLTSTVLALVRGIHEELAFDRMPILADALQDAGCEDSYILDHCRNAGPHTRGCWVVDLLLGK